MTNIWDTPRTAEAAVGDAQRAMDNAVRTMFELATRLELLREAIERANTVTPGQSWEHGGASFPRLAEETEQPSRLSVL